MVSLQQANRSLKLSSYVNNSFSDGDEGTYVFALQVAQVNLLFGFGILWHWTSSCWVGAGNPPFCVFCFVLK